MNEQLLDHLPDGVLLLEEERILLANSTAAEVLGISVRRLVGSTLAESLPEGSVEVVQRVLEGASSCTMRDLPWVRSVSTKRVSVTGTPGPTPGQIVLVVRTTSDTTGHGAAEGFRRRLAWLDSLAAGMAHEIRNPLGGIRGAAQLLLRGPAPEEADELKRLIIQEADRIDDLVERLMALTRPQTLTCSPVPLNRLVHDEVALLRARFGRSSVNWELDLDPSLPTAEGDPQRLREAVGNLLLNAQEAARERVHVRTRVEAGGRLGEDGFERGATLRIDVVDDGEGIEPERLPTLFDPFATTKPDGTGLGLFVTRRAIEDHRGLLDVDPRPGLGARFTVIVSEHLPPSAQAMVGGNSVGRLDSETPNVLKPPAAQALRMEPLC